MTIKAWTFAVALPLTLIGCVNDKAGSPEQAREADIAEQQQNRWNPMLRNYADNLIIPAYQRAEQVNAALASDTDALTSYCQSLGTEQEPAAREDAKQAWREAMAAWQQAELYQLGPLADNGGALRNRIHSFGSNAPLSECAVDQSVVLAEAEGFDLASRSYSSRGLDALEYLLFSDNLEHQCAAHVSATQGWNELPELERKARRCNYARLLAQDVHEASTALTDAWAEQGGNYRFEFLHPAYVEERLKALSDALFYIETHTKDLKVGIPSGIHANCSQIVCEGAVESPFSQTSLANVRNNLVEFKNMLLGGEGLGFDDAIISAGFPEVVEAFVADTDLAIGIIDASDNSLYQQLVAIEQSGDHSACGNSAANPEVASGIPACRVHGALKRITDRLRTDFVTIVNLDLPDRAQSDND